MIFILKDFLEDATAEVLEDEQELQTDKTEGTGLMKNSKTISDLDLTEENGLIKTVKQFLTLK